MANATKYPENELFKAWRSSAGLEKEDKLRQLTKALSTHAYAVCWLKIPDHRGEFPAIVNEAIWRAIKGAEKFRGESAFGSWFHRIALNECNRLLKTKQTRDVETSIEEMTNDVVSSEADPDRRLLLLSLLRSLPDTERTLAEMKLQGLKDWEIAEQLGTTESAVWNRWEKIKETLKDGRT